MSDYLRRLAERAVGVAKSIAPRAPYRFETAATSLSEIPSDEPPDEVARMDDEGRTPDTAAKDPLPGRADTLRPPSRSSERSPVDVSPLSHGTIVTTASTVPDKPETGLAGSSPMTPRVPGATRDSKRHAQPDRSPQRNDTSKSGAAARRERTAPAQNARTGSESQLPPLEKVAAKHTSGVPSASTIGPERLAPQPFVAGRSSASRSEGTRLVAHAREVVRKPSGNGRDVRRAMDERSSDRKPGWRQEHTVAVTIGRVEVRAVMEPPKAPSRPRRAATSGISLYDYLERHEEKRR